MNKHEFDHNIFQIFHDRKWLNTQIDYQVMQDSTTKHTVIISIELNNNNNHNRIHTFVGTAENKGKARTKARSEFVQFLRDLHATQEKAAQQEIFFNSKILPQTEMPQVQTQIVDNLAEVNIIQGKSITETAETLVINKSEIDSAVSIKSEIIINSSTESICTSPMSQSLSSVQIY